MYYHSATLNHSHKKTVRKGLTCYLLRYKMKRQRLIFWAVLRGSSFCIRTNNYQARPFLIVSSAVHPTENFYNIFFHIRQIYS